LDLIDALHAVLDRILERDNIHLLPIDLAQSAEERRTLPTPGWPCGEEDSTPTPDQTPDTDKVLRRESQSIEICRGCAGVQKAKHGRLATLNRKSRTAAAQRSIPVGEGESSVLWSALHRDVHFAEDFDTGEKRGFRNGG
jgi:hypothetical protein